MLSRFALLHDIYMLFYMISFHSFLRLSNIPLHKHTDTHTRHLYPFVCWRALPSPPYAGYWKQCSREGWSARVFLGLCFCFLWIYIQEWDCKIVWCYIFSFLRNLRALSHSGCSFQLSKAVSWGCRPPVLSHWFLGRGEARKQNIGTNDFLKRIIRL